MSGQQIDTYTAGTVAVASGSKTVVGTGTNWTTSDSAGVYSVIAGHMFVCNDFEATIDDVVDGTHLVLSTPFVGTTASGQAYKIIRYSWVETAAAVGTLQKQLNKGTKAQPVTRWDLDSSVASMSLRDDGTGNPAIFVGATGAADGAQSLAVTYDRITGIGTAASFKVTGTLLAQNFQVMLAGVPATDAYLTAIQGVDPGNNAFLHIGGATSNIDGLGAKRRIAMFADVIYATGNLGLGQFPAAGYTLSVNGGSIFSNSLNLTDGNFFYCPFNGSTNTGEIRAGLRFDGTGQTLQLWSSNSNRWTVGAAGHLAAGADNAYSLGTASGRASVVYAGTGAINTSDAGTKRLRAATEDLPEGHLSDIELDAFGAVRAGIFQMRDAIAEKGDDARWHVGWIAQEVADAYTALGLDPFRYAPICKDAVTKRVVTMVPSRVPVFDMVERRALVVEVDAEGIPRQVETSTEDRVPRTVSTPVLGLDGEPLMRAGVLVMHPVPVTEDGEVEHVEEIPDGERWGLRYDQCLVLETAWLRRELSRQAARLATMEAAVVALQSDA